MPNLKRVSLNGSESAEHWLVFHDKELHAFSAKEAAIAFLESLEWNPCVGIPIVYRGRELGFDVSRKLVSLSVSWLAPLGHGILRTTIDDSSEELKISRLQYDALVAAGIEEKT